ncbi:MlaD family protein [Sphingomonas sp. ID0503]|uniref:MlaD family protein n=1 Tax=Sphingomonas sp. ID0503 TaxID=3399691 RepID=UPI003AFB8126
METRSNHVLVGGIVLALVVATLGFILWMANLSGDNTHRYDIFFGQSVDGLAKGSTVTYAGVPSGKIEEIKLMPETPDLVRVRIAVDGDTPVLQGTSASIAGVGFTGVSQINLDGAVRGAPPITAPGPLGVPVIPTKRSGLGALLNSAPALLERLTSLTERLTATLSPENQKSISGILANLDKVTGALGDRAPEIAATLAETRIAIQQAGAAAEQIGRLAGSTNNVMQRDVSPAMADLRRATASAAKTMDSLDALIADARPGVQNFSKTTAPEVGLLVRDLRDMSQALTAVAGRLDRGGAGGLIGGSKLPDYKGK